ncbi:MAG: glycosyltransferase family 2 protein [Marinomonas sp.]
MERKLKLVAIARDESAYLPEWIYHHLSMGFDEIEVLVNYTEDNSITVLEKIGLKYPVKYRVIDKSIIDESQDFQISAYKMAAKELSAGFDYLMFLDIDEFWTDSEGKKKIKDLLLEYNYPEALSFQWGIKLETNKLFDLCYSEENEVISSRFSRVIFKLNPFPEKINVHKVDIKSGRYLFSNGKEVVVKNKSELGDDLFDVKKIDRYFVCHRIYRSELEYVSLLGRGRPRHHNEGKEEFKLKDNRFGYKTTFNNKVKYQYSNYKEYSDKYHEFIGGCDIWADLDEAKLFVINRYHYVIRRMMKMKGADINVINKVLNGVTTEEVQDVFEKIREREKVKKKESKLTDALRDAAIALEKENVNLSLKLMKIAKSYREHGALINKKIKEYQEIINS